MDTLPAYIFFPRNDLEKEYALKILSEITEQIEYQMISTNDFSSITFHNETSISLLSPSLEEIKRKNKSYHFIKLTFQEFKQQCFKYSITIGKSS